MCMRKSKNIVHSTAYGRGQCCALSPMLFYTFPRKSVGERAAQVGLDACTPFAICSHMLLTSICCPGTCCCGYRAYLWAIAGWHKERCACCGAERHPTVAQGNNTRDLLNVTTDAHGEFSFSGLDTDKTINYAVYTLYQGAQYYLT